MSRNATRSYSRVGRRPNVSQVPSRSSRRRRIGHRLGRLTHLSRWATPSIRSPLSDDEIAEGPCSPPSQVAGHLQSARTEQTANAGAFTRRRFQRPSISRRAVSGIEADHENYTSSASTTVFLEDDFTNAPRSQPQSERPRRSIDWIRRLVVVFNCPIGRRLR